ncbi:antiporter inner membrane protein [Propionibacterium australiense]|uniref:Iron-sulfur cluster carrier protein n=2 Tax=Propionibacterium australiense TaxID=119981 RepID=A0A383S8D6_9ACTN|nr:Mrp, conserved site [Propionibacterium australiense]VEH89639.1 antiporter inner membrane protein [Propionibacterium australiense]
MPMSEASSPLLSQIRAALHNVQDPEIRRPIDDLGMVEDVSVGDDGVVTVKILLTVPGCPMHATIKQDVTNVLSAIRGVTGVEVEMGVMNDEQRAAMRESLQGGRAENVIPFSQPGNLTRVVAVASGKGGVGKSSVTVNLALALAQRGLKVGLLDADIYGHSIPDLLGIGEARPTVLDEMILPVPVSGITVISMGMLKQSRDQVIAWRGPILDRAITQLLSDVFWGDLDYLLIDLPPGTGDVALAVGQKIPNSDVLVVTTPQSNVSEVSERAGTMAEMLHQHVLGVVENMSYYDVECPHCHEHHKVELFGTGGGQATADALSERCNRKINLLVQIPVDPRVSAGGETGSPIVLTDENSPTTQAIQTLAAIVTSHRKGLKGKPLNLSVS